jgi:hypothetical protein
MLCFDSNLLATIENEAVTLWWVQMAKGMTALSPYGPE